jgi:hypothetical protein
MITIHQIRFENANNQEEVWKIYRVLKLQRKGKKIKEILEEIALNWNELSKVEVSEEKAKGLISLQKIKKTPSKLISLLNQTKDPELRTWLREEIKRMVEGQNEDLF